MGMISDEANQCMGMISDEANQCMGMISDEANQCMGMISDEWLVMKPISVWGWLGGHDGQRPMGEFFSIEMGFLLIAERPV